MKRRYTLTLAAVALAACTPDFDPASKVDKMRVLAVRADPPEIEPAGPTTVAPDRAMLTSLILRAELDPEPAHTTTVVHVACIPDPMDPAPTACVTFDALRDLDALVARVAGRACDMTPQEASPDPFLAGVEACGSSGCVAASTGGVSLRRAEIAAPAGYFDVLARANPAAPELKLGVQAIVLAFVLDAAPDELAQGVVATCPEADLLAGFARLWGSREHVVATKRVVIRGPDAPDLPNQNPAIDDIYMGDVCLERDVATTIPARKALLAPFTADADALHESYTELDAAGNPISSKREEWAFSWFSTAGDIDELHTRDGETDEWDVASVPDGSRALIAAVARDLRGGVGWAVREVRISR